MARLGLRAYRFSVAWPRVQPSGDGGGQRARPGLLRPAGGRAAGARHPALRYPVSLGPAPGAAGPGRLAGPRHRPALRRVRGDRGPAPGRPGRLVDHAQRAGHVAAMGHYTGQHAPGRAQPAGLRPRRPPPPALPRPRCPGHPRRGAFEAPRRHRPQPESGLPGLARRQGRRCPLRPGPQPALPGPAAARELPGRAPGQPGAGPRRGPAGRSLRHLHATGLFGRELLQPRHRPALVAAAAGLGPRSGAATRRGDVRDVGDLPRGAGRPAAAPVARLPPRRPHHHRERRAVGGPGRR